MRVLALFGAILFLAGCQPEITVEQRIAEREALAQANIADCVAIRCTTLDLDGQGIAEYSILNDLTHLRVLMISYTDFSDLNDIAALTGLEELHIGATNVTDLTLLSSFPNLRVLHIQSNDFTDVGSLTALQKLEELAIGKNNLTDVSFVRSLPRLKNLDIAYSDVVDLGQLRGHPALEILALEHTAVTDLSPLLQIRTLRQISVVEPYTDEEVTAQHELLRGRGIRVEYEPAMVVC